jgi:prephenate dehydrogenase
MTIGIIGLGLIGASLAAAIHENTYDTVLGLDINENTMRAAMGQRTVDGALSQINISTCDVIIIALYPRAAIQALNEIAPFVKKGTVITDCCGIKRQICTEGKKLAEQYGFTFIGGHPMAGRECWGYESAKADLYKGASMIITPDPDESKSSVLFLSDYFLSLGFGRITKVTAEEHDAIIACTSQLAHVLSSSYIRSDTAAKHEGLSAGSFRDMTRVAALNDRMWSEIFLDNKDNLLNEINGLIKHLQDYRNAIAEDDRESLAEMMRDSTHKRAVYFHNQMI